MNLIVTLTFRTSRVNVAGWGQWSSWGDCSRSCGTGARFRSRRCDSPRPAYGGQHCAGDREEFKLCNVVGCLEPLVKKTITRMLVPKIAIIVVCM